MKAEYYIKKLGLQKHPEGGWFKEVYRSDEDIAAEHLPERFSGSRHHSTSIYFLLTSDTFSAFHRIKSDELWHFYEGSAVTIYMIDSEGNYSEITLGRNIESGEVLQCVIPHGVWFGAKVNSADSFCLAGCTVAPGFHFDDFELGEREELLKIFPKHKKIVNELTRR
ncbi:MAG TPA: cupin domain-containing protein [Ignavibacteria bacterium]|mgnify:FL=1|nr:cupin domain-containing protein [Ignavibacteria bacterium]HRF64342.1 cupin domain-containing protein [Ignavibacteria bacterium]